MRIYVSNGKVYIIKRNGMSVSQDLAAHSWYVIIWKMNEHKVSLIWVEEMQICTGYWTLCI